MKCFGCQRKLDFGDRYIEDTASGFIGSEDGSVDGLLADIFGGTGGKLVFCDDCTVDGGDYMFETVYGDEDDV
jgi:hypothetical protein